MAKKAVSKKTVAKKAPVKKAVAKKAAKPVLPAGKKTVTKKPPVKKAAVKKPVGKKAVSKKAAAKKVAMPKKVIAPPKVIPSKKAAAKKVVAKKRNINTQAAPELQLPDATVEKAANIKDSGRDLLMVPRDSSNDVTVKMEDPAKTFDKQVFNKASGDPHKNMQRSSKPKNSIKPSGKKPLW